VNDIHDETIEALVDAGLRDILVGLESGRDDSLRRLNKMTTVFQNESAVRILRKHGIEPNIGFIMFEPYSSLEDVRANFDFLLRNDLLGILPVTVNVLYHHQIILRGTPAFHVLQKEGRLDLLPGGAYEGTARFTDLRVAELADIMRQITNFLFHRMSGVWSGKEAEPRGAQEKYLRVNQILVDLFESSLHAYETDRRLTREERDALVQETQKEIERAFENGSP
jgi:radical SAM superfamily enzyme YgiQ (UPF0313 family)